MRLGRAVCGGILLAALAAGGVLVVWKRPAAEPPPEPVRLTLHELPPEEEGERLSQYDELIRKYAARYDFDWRLIAAMIAVESRFDAECRTADGGMGLMQLMPVTYDWIRTRLGEDSQAEPEGDIFDPELNLRYGIYYLSYLYGEFGVWETAWAGYNAGPNIVKQWLQDSRYSEDGVTLHTIPYTETANYVVKVGDAREYYQRLLAE